MISSNRRKNNYIVGRPIHEPELFFGRESLFQTVADSLRQDTKVILLQGQRRIGKSSVLKQIPNFVGGDEFVFVFFDLQNKSRLALSNILHQLGGAIVKIVGSLRSQSVDTPLISGEDPPQPPLIRGELLGKSLEERGELVSLSAPSVEDLAGDIDCFAQKFLPQVYRILGDKKLVLLIDEFDVLSDTSIDVDGGGFFQYLSSLIYREEKLFLIPVIGRRLEDLSHLLGLFKDAPYQEIGLLDEASAKRLITQPAAGILDYTEDAIAAILELSAGHPYFTQVICFVIFIQAQVEENFKVTREDVENIVDRAMENAEAGLVWFRDGLPIPERVVLLAAAEAEARAKDKGDTLFDEPSQLLEEYGVVLTEQLVRAKDTLVEWGIINIENKVKVELVLSWLVKSYSLHREIWQLEKIDLIANHLYEAANNFPQEEGISKYKLQLYQQVLETNPNHFNTLFALADEYNKLFEFNKAVGFYNRAFKVDPTGIKTKYVASLLNYGNQLMDEKEWTKARKQFEHVLSIESENSLAKRTLEEIEGKLKLVGGRYEILRELGRGGFSITYLARDVKILDNLCVIKKLEPLDEAIYLETKRLFKQQCEILIKLRKHSQIPKFMDYFEEDGDLYLVTEYIDGNALSQELRQEKQLSESYVISILNDVLEILQFIHKNRVIHRDIQPSNLIKNSKDGKLFLIDFGVAKSEFDSTIKSQTIIIGTPGYMPIEQIEGFPNFTSDIYALGITAIQALTGLNPHELEKPFNYNRELIWQDKVNVSEGLGYIISTMVKRNWRDRYQSATEVLQALEELENSPNKLLIKTKLELAREKLQTQISFGYGMAIIAFIISTITFLSLFIKMNNPPNPNPTHTPEQLQSDDPNIPGNE